MKCEFFEGLSSVLASLIFCIVLVLPAAIVGCAEKEKVLDIKTPNTSIEVEKDTETGQTDVEIDREPAGAASPVE